MTAFPYIRIHDESFRCFYCRRIQPFFTAYWDGKPRRKKSGWDWWHDYTVYASLCDKCKKDLDYPKGKK